LAGLFLGVQSKLEMQLSTDAKATNAMVSRLMDVRMLPCIPALFPVPCDALPWSLSKPAWAA
jgi:hypothetical protein